MIIGKNILLTLRFETLAFPPSELHSIKKAQQVIIEPSGKY